MAEREKQAIEAKLLNPYFETPRRQNPLVEGFWHKYLDYSFAVIRLDSVHGYWPSLVFRMVACLQGYAKTLGAGGGRGAGCACRRSWDRACEGTMA